MGLAGILILIVLTSIAAGVSVAIDQGQKLGSSAGRTSMLRAGVATGIWLIAITAFLVV